MNCYKIKHAASRTLKPHCQHDEQLFRQLPDEEDVYFELLVDLIPKITN